MKHSIKHCAFLEEVQVSEVQVRDGKFNVAPAGINVDAPTKQPTLDGPKSERIWLSQGNLPVGMSRHAYGRRQDDESAGTRTDRL